MIAAIPLDTERNESITLHKGRRGHRGPNRGREGCEGEKGVFINPVQLAELMIEHGLGVITTKTYEITVVSNDFFDESEG
jgi:hypothetical protein